MKSNDKRTLRDMINRFKPREFEFAVVDVLEQIGSFHHIEITRRSPDGGFDFTAKFPLSNLDYDIEFLGEVKQRRKGGIGVKEVSRLVARLNRGQLGIFLTTSYFTRQAQEEVLADKYPVKLVYAKRLVLLMRKRA